MLPFNLRKLLYVTDLVNHKEGVKEKYLSSKAKRGFSISGNNELAPLPLEIRNASPPFILIASMENSRWMQRGTPQYNIVCIGGLFSRYSIKGVSKTLLL